VKQSISLERFTSFARSRHIDLDNTQCMQLEHYLHLILFWSKKQNLISKNDQAYIIERHFLPSLFLCDILKKYHKIYVLDVGSGAGFPGVILQIIRPDFRVRLIDSSRKKYLFLCEVIEKLNLPSESSCERIESFARNTNQTFDIVISRAVAGMSKLWLWTEPVLKTRSRIFLLKGKDIKNEIAEINQWDLHTQIIYPGHDWIRISSNLKSKCIVTLERKNV
jgi:16S rRNA (guanine527-N7)-methyltransferase